jgi:formate hydrogenlyase subunit 6/NADH:ubiquinone oxidoreductase subunit I
VTLVSQKMGIHEWSYDNEVAPDTRFKVPWRDVNQALRNIKVEVELGFDVQTAWKEAQRCLNCDVQTVFFAQQCIECDACVDVCPTDCITIVGAGDAGVGTASQSALLLDEEACIRCGLCVNRCPPGALVMTEAEEVVHG